MDKTGIVCPSCGRDDLEIGNEEIEIPNFGKSDHYYIRCKACGYKLNDFAFSGKHPVNAEIVVSNKGDLSKKIVRGGHCKVSIPELGLSISPGPVSESFITNIEGLLERFLRVLPLFDESLKTDEKRKQIMNAMDGLLKFTVRIEDQTGVSHFIDDNAPADTS